MLPRMKQRAFAMTINVVRPNHGPASSTIRSIHYRFARDVNPLAINPRASDRPWFRSRHRRHASHHCHRSTAACHCASSHTNTSTRLSMIVGASITDCRHRQNVSETNDRCIAPRAIVHLKPPPDHLLGNGCEGLPINAMIMLVPSSCREVSQSRAIVCNLANSAAWSVYRLRARTITQSKPWLGGPKMPALMQNTNDVATAVWPG
jgi:hypothetical protein